MTPTPAQHSQKEGDQKAENENESNTPFGRRNRWVAKCTGWACTELTMELFDGWYLASRLTWGYSRCRPSHKAAGWWGESKLITSILGFNWLNPASTARPHLCDQVPLWMFPGPTASETAHQRLVVGYAPTTGWLRKLFVICLGYHLAHIFSHDN